MKQRKKPSRDEVLTFVSDALIGPCAGAILDYFAKTTWIFTVVGLVLGPLLAIVLKRRKERGNTDERNR